MSLVTKLVDKISEFIRLKGEKLKLDIIAQVSGLLAHFVAFMVIGVILFFIMVFLSIALGAYLNLILQSTFYGYLIVAGSYVILLVAFVILLRTNKMQAWLETFFMSLTDSSVSEEISEDED